MDRLLNHAHRTFHLAIAHLALVEFGHVTQMQESQPGFHLVERAIEQLVTLGSVCGVGHQEDVAVPEVKGVLEFRHRMVDVAPHLHLKGIGRH
jgi:hypothetical protein